MARSHGGESKLVRVVLIQFVIIVGGEVVGWHGGGEVQEAEAKADGEDGEEKKRGLKKLLMALGKDSAKIVLVFH